MKGFLSGVQICVTQSRRAPRSPDPVVLAFSLLPKNLKASRISGDKFFKVSSAPRPNLALTVLALAESLRLVRVNSPRRRRLVSGRLHVPVTTRRGNFQAIDERSGIQGKHCTL